MLLKKRFSFLSYVFLVSLITAMAGNADASSQAPQTWLPGDCIPQFAVKMPVFGPGPNADLPRVDALRHPLLTVKMKEASRAVLPDPTVATYPATDSSGNACPTVSFQNTKIWAYETSDSITGKLLGPAFWPAVTVETRRYIPTLMNYVNELPSGPGTLQDLISVDQTVHWADPVNLACMMRVTPVNCITNPGDPCCKAYSASTPAVPHLHGGEVPSQFDGGPEAWFTPDGKKGPAYSSLVKSVPGKATYLYNNFQEPGTPWFHDHALGATRTNVYSGLAAFYFIRDPLSEPKNLPAGAYEIEMAIQDRQFDANSQLFFPDGSGLNAAASNLNGTPPNPAMHPFWIPEFIGDVAVVNGSPWTYLNVEPRRYRFRIVDGSNARFYNLTFGDAIVDGLLTPVPVYAIGADDAYLDKPAGPLNAILIAPGERTDIIVDFTGFAGKNITVTNNARVPYPAGPAVPGTLAPLPGDFAQPGMARIMQFHVGSSAVADTSCNPAASGCSRPKPIVRLTDGMGNITNGVKIAKVRQLVLKEHTGFDTTTTPPTETGPLEVLVNNTKWNGLNSPSNASVFPKDGISELPKIGTVEMWEIINLTMDAHPMHTHLTQFQILNRQNYDMDGTMGSNLTGGYPATWAAAFGSLLPVGCDGIDPLNPCPGYGPPLPYNVPNADGALGGNPALKPYLVGLPAKPAPEESGWKDTAKALPGQVTRILVRWTPTSTPMTLTKPGLNLYPFDPTKGPGYVWHCHIIDHEDNEMMRPYKVTK